MSFMNKWRFFPLTTYTPQENMAIDEAIFRLKIMKYSSIPNTVRFYRWNPSSVSIGKNQSLYNEVDVDACKKNNISIVRRISGGGAVFHMFEGEITYSIITDMASIGVSNFQEAYNRILLALTKGLNKLSLNANQGQINCPALFINSKKISGNAQASSGNILLQHGTVLIRYNPELMYTVLKARPDKPRTKMIQSVYAYITTLEQLGVTTDFPTIVSNLTKGFFEEFSISSKMLIKPEISSKEDSLVKHFIKSRYDNWDWTERRFEEKKIPDYN
ncbi:MAG: biotin/lipoate A/B protein ligase family protein [Candidatus Thorarchaeota archaeon]